MRGRVLPPNVSRRVAQRKPKFSVTIVCEGKKTEPYYFEAFANEYGNMLVSVTVVPGAGVPMSVVDAAIRLRNSKTRKKKNSFEEADEVWAVFDCDEHPKIKEATNKARSKSVNVAYSNPCFELWALLHIQDHDAPIHRHDLQKLLKEIMEGYDPQRGKGLNYSIMKAQYETACKRAERMAQRRVDEGNEHGNPFTDVYKLTEKIVANGKKLASKR
ncbi:RloB family protein [Microvirga terrestris]|uniref:RloB domain-containing protein n=1 Tax=Microvirga terrestris TaxID=2791024 RepID=A0ABS0HLT5_9HYPH|nr:RloB family protein [Microvirga terrestris]MBF9194440.1 RloB domain-containing protein [Microvirga terrestris]